MTTELEAFLADMDKGEGFAAPQSFAEDDGLDQGALDTGDGLPEKYQGKSAEEVYALMKREAEYNRGRGGAAPEFPEYNREASTEVYGEALTAGFEAAGVNPFEIDKRVRAGERIPAETVDRLGEALGVPAEIVNHYLSSFAPGGGGRQPSGATLQEAQREVIGFLGGEESAASLARWAETNVPPGEIGVLNEHLEAGRVAQAKKMLGEFWARRAGGQGQPSRIRGDSGGRSGAAAFRTMSELEASLNKKDPVTKRRLYDEDPSYRRAHDRRVIASDLFK